MTRRHKPAQPQHKPAEPSRSATAGHDGSRVLLPVGDGGRCRVQIGSDPDAIRTLTRLLDGRVLPQTYVTAGAPVVVEAVSGTAVQAGDEDAPLPLAAGRVTPARLAALLAEHVDLWRARTDPKGNPRQEEVMPTRTVLGAVLSPRHWPSLPVLQRIIGTPVLRPDGTLLQDPGYDPATGFYLAGRTQLPRIPQAPSPGEVDAAAAFLLNEFLVDFPWRTDADRANYLALLATPIIRPYTRALSPFAVIDATMPGSGKTILTSCIGLLVGQKVVTWPADDDSELRKTITTVLREQVGAVVFDNLTEGSVITSPVLARLITERTWDDRRLQTNTAASFPNDRLWLATGNNLRTGGDMATRTVWVRLDPDCPAPEARAGFAIPHLDTWILDPGHQAILLGHLLTLIVDWTRAGAPQNHHVPHIRQFTRWAQHLGGLLDHIGVPGFLANHAELATELDDHATAWRAFLLRWHHTHADRRLSADQLRRTAEPDAGPDPWAGTFPTTPTGRLVSTVSLGRTLTGRVNRWTGDLVLRSTKDPTTNKHLYWVHHDPTTTN